VPQDRLCRASLHGVRIYNGGFEMKILVTRNLSSMDVQLITVQDRDLCSTASEGFALCSGAEKNQLL